LIGYMLGPTSAALYGLTIRAHEAALLFLAQVNGSIAPSMAHLWGSGNADRFRELIMRIALIGALAGGVCMAVIIAVNADFVALWLHERGFAGQTTSILMAVMIWVSAAGSVAYDALYALGRFRLIATTFVFTALTHVAILIGLLPHGLWGAALATLISTLLWSAVFWWQLQHTIQLHRAHLKRMLGDFLATGACGAGIAAALLIVVPRVETWTGVISVAIVCAIAATAIILLLNPHIRAICRIEAAMTARTVFARRRTHV
jgi:O-antigen/teichoic acid export membrane protein